MAEDGTGSSRKRAHEILISAAALGLYLFLAYRSAWLSDDALISLRTASNFLHGYGLRWNVDERVQSFTHPLWLFVLIAAHALTGEPFYSSLITSWLISGCAVALLLFACPGTTPSKLMGLAVLLVSQAFMDFSSSGLENPLTHVFIVLFVAAWTRCTTGPTRLSALSAIVVCAALNRLDTVLLFVPASVLEVVRSRREHRLVRYLVAAAPLVGWEIFSVIYYGFPFPNTAYAKLAQAQVATPVLDGLNYLYSSLQTDPITLCAIAGCIVFTLVRRDLDRACLVGGAALYLAYVVRIGGDFMNGRFLSAPLCMCIVCVATSDWVNARRGFVVAVGIVIAARLGHWSPLPAREDYIQKPIAHYINRFGIHDERRLFFAVDSLSNASKMNPMMRDHPWSSAGFELRDAARATENRVQLVEAIGHAGYFAGPEVHLIDHWALSDALIARLPAVHGKYGHYPRVIPDGYIETLATHQDHLADRNLAEYYRKLSLVIRGPLWNLDRLKTIWQLNIGTYQPLLDRYAYVRRREVSIKEQFVNQTSHSCVLVYVWNDFRASAYELDCASNPGKIYSVAWLVTPTVSTLVYPAGLSRTSNLPGLRKDGWFSVSVAFSDQPGGPIKELYELRYTYRIENDQLFMQRQPWPVWIKNFPVGPWHDGVAPGFLLYKATE